LLGVGGTSGLSPRWITSFAVASGLIVGVGVIDDRWGMSAWIKLGCQMIAAALFMLANWSGAGSVLGYAIPPWADLGIHIAWAVILINGFNLIDGMDGLCAGLGLIASIILGILAAIQGSIGEAVLCGVMASALLGFLRFNFHPAKIFLGDSGSMLIGFFIATAGASAAGRQSVTAAILLPLLIGGVPLLDVGLAVWRRAARRFAVSKPGAVAVRVFGPDRDHLHHRMLEWGFTQRRTACLIYTIAIALALISLMPMIGGSNWLGLSVISLIIAGLVGLRYLAPLEFVTSGETLRALVRRPWPSRIYVLSYYLYDLLALTISSGLAWWIVSKLRVTEPALSDILRSTAIFVACGLVGLRGAKAQSRRWSRACLHDFFELVLWLSCGIGISFVLQSWTLADFSFAQAVQHIIAGSAALFLIFLPRSIGFVCIEGVIDAMHRKKRLPQNGSNHTTILYGAGDLGELFLCNLRLSKAETWQKHHFIGFIDDNPALVGRQLRGFRILGTSSGLKELAQRYRFDTIMLTQSALGEEKLHELEKECHRLGLNLKQWLPELSAENLYSIKVGKLCEDPNLEISEEDKSSSKSDVPGVARLPDQALQEAPP
jgi:UDP-N-acetylmuramyl pentapeptide phosphotransferase/UDP-N-acetylglucosamine-1-phosphate transferase